MGCVDLRSLYPAGDAPTLRDGQRRVQVQTPGGALLQPKPGNRIWGGDCRGACVDHRPNRGQPKNGNLQRTGRTDCPGVAWEVRAQAKAQPDDSFVVLLKGLYQPVTHGPNLGLS